MTYGNPKDDVSHMVELTPTPIGIKTMCVIPIGVGVKFAHITYVATVQNGAP